MSFSIEAAAIGAKAACNAVVNLDASTRAAVLEAVACELSHQQAAIIAANDQDIAAAHANDMPAAMVDRLKLDAQRIAAIADAVRQIAAQPEVIGSIDHMYRRPNGIQVGKMRIPLGVIAMIYESRPNVTIDAAALCFKAGNAVILRGGKEALHSNLALANCLHTAFAKFGIPADAVTVIPDPARDIMQQMLTLDEHIDLVIPRGGEGLIRYVTENSRIPVIQHFKGVCHLYIDQYADLSKALDILENGKVQRPSVCNALETVLIHADLAPKIMPQIAALLASHQVKVHACAHSIDYFAEAEPATDADWAAEYLALEIAVKIVANDDEAIAHIQQYGSGHTEVIVSQDTSVTQRFMQRVNSSVIMVNASSRFSDGGELGLGAEIGISTSKLHAYGPMGAAQLTTEKFVVIGDGQIRG